MTSHSGLLMSPGNHKHVLEGRGGGGGGGGGGGERQWFIHAFGHQWNLQ